MASNGATKCQVRVLGPSVHGGNLQDLDEFAAILVVQETQPVHPDYVADLSPLGGMPVCLQPFEAVHARRYIAQGPQKRQCAGNDGLWSEDVDLQ